MGRKSNLIDHTLNEKVMVMRTTERKKRGGELINSRINNETRNYFSKVDYNSTQKNNVKYLLLAK